MRKKILDELVTKTKTNPTYSQLTRVIKIVKQVFFSGKSEDKEETDQDKQGKKKEKVIVNILLSNTGEYKRLLQFFTQEIPKLILKACSIAEKFPKEGQTYDLKKMYGHLSSKQ